MFLHKGLLNKEAAPVPDIYVQNDELRNMIEDIRSENLTLKNSVLKLSDELKKVKNERDYHMIKHRQTLQDKEKLHCDVKRVKEHYAEYEPILRLLRQKYETAIKEKTLHRIERDKAMNQVEGLRHALTSLQKLGITSNDANDIENVDLNHKITEKRLENTTSRQNKKETDQKCKKNYMRSEKFNIQTKLDHNLKRVRCL
ncbi:Sperm-associated antigen 16 protein, variant 3 [Schistosoma haematobium]|uniref:Sperm-associated antigen 16 protein, variant 3 n=1 Tax=Schistosoma haematobium TaxID=6185 RepID=A0A922LLS8_SCHHA|nr:Sperm-associated antigen 16 protein, variant 3 [Schistosoma haematobium]KAH9588540.1 Sperm-associated antigen 16 protein, variant 3 [Schistosoma haematobium]